MSSAAQEPPPVDWSQVKEEILCPLCDYNLRGLIEPRCPECGYRFEWKDMLDPDRRRHPYLFEHHPRHNVWSFFKTLRGGLRPRTFWTSLWPGQRSAPGRLAAYWVAVITTLLLLPACALVNDGVRMARDNLANRKSFMQRLPAASLANARYPDWHRSIKAILDRKWPLPPSTAFFRQVYDNHWWRLNREIGAALSLSLLVLSWPWLTYLSLLIFQISMSRAKVKTVHVARCIIYSADVTFWLSTVILLLSLAGGAATFAVSGRLADWGPDLVLPLLILPCGGIFIYRLAIAYMKYLKFDWPVATVLSSQIITALMTLLLLVLWSLRQLSRWM